MRIATRPQRVLVIDPFLPMWDRNSGSNRLLRVLELLAADRHEITFVAVNGGGEKDDGYAKALTDMGITVHRSDPERLRVMEPYVDLERTTTTPRRFDDLVRQGAFDVAIVSFHTMARQYLPLLRKLSPTTQVIIDTVDLHFVRELRAAELSGDPLERQQAEQRKATELATYRSADGLIAVSAEERAALLAEIPEATVHVVPNIHDVEDIPVPFGQRRGLLFVANFLHPPNGEGLWWFVREVLPLVHRQLPDVPVDVVGQFPPRQIVEARSPLFRVHGWTPSLEQHLYGARLSIAPLLHGAGMKGKVGQAFACGLPVVTTSVGAEGFGVEHRTHAMVADDAQAFADCIVEAYSDEHLWNELRTSAQRLIQATLTPAAARARLREVVPATVSSPVELLALPDWQDAGTLASVIDDYVTAFHGRHQSRLRLGILRGTSADEALRATMDALLSRGHDPERIPELSLDELSAEAIGAMPPDTVWVPTGDAPRPAHLRSVLEAWPAPATA